MPIEGLSSWTASIGISASLNFCLACTRQALINTGLKRPLALYQRCGERLGQLADQFLQTSNIIRIKARTNRAVEVTHAHNPLVMDDQSGRASRWDRGCLYVSYTLFSGSFKK